jgi:hypothetical protein
MLVLWMSNLLLFPEKVEKRNFLENFWFFKKKILLFTVFLSVFVRFSLIMNQHYARTAVPNRPRIFAMSAPLVTGNVEEHEMKKRIKNLEKL